MSAPGIACSRARMRAIPVKMAMSVRLSPPAREASVSSPLWMGNSNATTGIPAPRMIVIRTSAVSFWRSPGDLVMTGMPAPRVSIASKASASEARTSVPPSAEMGRVRPPRERRAHRVPSIVGSAPRGAILSPSRPAGAALVRSACVRRSLNAVRTPGQRIAPPCAPRVVKPAMDAKRARCRDAPAAGVRSACAPRARAAAPKSGPWDARRCAGHAGEGARTPVGTGRVIRFLEKIV